MDYLVPIEVLEARVMAEMIGSVIALIVIIICHKFSK